MKFRYLALSFCLLLFGCTVLSAQSQKTQISVHSDDNEWMMSRTEDGRELRVRIRGKAEFNDDYSEITALAPGGSVRIRETRNGLTRRYEVDAENSGALKRAYFVNDAARAFDQDARQWLAGLLLDLVRQSGFDAERRVARLFQQGGARAVLDEIALIRGDYGKRIYFNHLLNQPGLDSATVQHIVQETARTLSSAYEKRQVLARVAEKYLDDALVRTEFITAIGTIDSDYERAQVLLALLKRHALTPEQQQAALQAAAGISSDYEKARVLIRLVESDAGLAGAQAVFFDAVNALRSDYERSRVLLALLSHGNPPGETLKQAIKAALNSSSDYEKARVLLRVAANSKNDKEIREALIEAARTITSEYERGRVLSAAVR